MYVECRFSSLFSNLISGIGASNNNKQFLNCWVSFEFALIVFVFDFIPGIVFDPKVGSGNDKGK